MNGSELSRQQIWPLRRSLIWRLAARRILFSGIRQWFAMGGMALATAILIGALAAGEAVQSTLRRQISKRLGRIELTVSADQQFFQAGLADRLGRELSIPVAAICSRTGMANAAGAVHPPVPVTILGVDERFWQLGDCQSLLSPAITGQLAVNRYLAGRLQLQPGDELVLRVPPVVAMPVDLPFTASRNLVPRRFTVAAVLDEQQFGGFSLEDDARPPLNVFLPREQLANLLERPGMANVLLAGNGTAASPATATVVAALRRSWQPADTGLAWHPLPGGGWQLSADRVLLPAAVCRPDSGITGAQGILSWLINEFRLEERSSAYSFATGLAPGLAFPGQTDGEIVINEWLAEDLKARPGDRISLSWYLPGPGGSLREQQEFLTVRQIVPLEGRALDPDLVPSLPGFTDVADCRTWDDRLPVDLKRVTRRDEEYWHRYQALPKAFVTLRTAERLWSSRFGRWTGLRAEAGDETVLSRRLLEHVTPAELGWVIRPVREESVAAAGAATSLTGVFLGVSILVTGAALLLAGMLLKLELAVQTRYDGVMQIFGFSRRQLLRLTLAEASLLALCSAVAGAAAGFLLQQLLVLGLNTIWREALAGMKVQPSLEPGSLAAGAVLGGLLSFLVAAWLGIRKLKTPLLGQLQTVSGQTATSHRKIHWPGIMASAFILLAGGLMQSGGPGQTQRALICWGVAGVLVMLAGILFCLQLLSILKNRPGRPLAGPFVAGCRSSARERGRSTGVIAMLAAGICVVVTSGAHRFGPSPDEGSRTSGTGGYTFFTELSRPFRTSPVQAGAWQRLGLAGTGDASHFLPVRVVPGDDASCRNLRRSRRPPLFGLDPQVLERRGAFTFQWPEEERASWNILEQDSVPGEIAGIVDEEVLVWGLGLRRGDCLKLTAEDGRPLRIRLAGTLAPSIFQGGIVVSEQALLRYFPSSAAVRILLLDAPVDRLDNLRQELPAALDDEGLHLTATSERLAHFRAVPAAYLAMFQLLGGLGVMLGTAGLGLVLSRNVLERRGELGVMTAMGFTRRQLQTFLWSENMLLLLAGLITGVAAGVVAAWPAWRAAGTNVPVKELALSLSAVTAAGLGSVWLALRQALRGELLTALRNE